MTNLLTAIVQLITVVFQILFYLLSNPYGLIGLSFAIASLLLFGFFGRLIDTSCDVLDNCPDEAYVVATLFAEESNDGISDIERRWGWFEALLDPDLAEELQYIPVDPPQTRLTVDGRSSNLRPCPYAIADCAPVGTVDPNEAIHIHGYVQAGAVGESSRWFEVIYEDMRGFMHDSRVQDAIPLAQLTPRASRTPRTTRTPVLPPTDDPNRRTYEVEVDNSVRKIGDWLSLTDTDASGRMYIHNGGCRVCALSITFEGDHIEIVYIGSSQFGRFDVHLNGEHYATIDAGSVDAVIHDQRFTVSGIEPGTHVLTIRPHDGAIIGVDAFVQRRE